ncbi:hypothetical protein HNY73_019534 [Argiope bruennichi]|uniref:Uncharacterized protein n=1 Tax=Argiope bruennichi TaxID=94029 RepID=A0A8T0E5D6_ARGBR|nr:hypothetical protein HNY73_019534 [Argiope bruennichi]
MSVDGHPREGWMFRFLRKFIRIDPFTLSSPPGMHFGTWAENRNILCEPLAHSLLANDHQDNGHRRASTGPPSSVSNPLVHNNTMYAMRKFFTTLAGGRAVGWWLVVVYYFDPHLVLLRVAMHGPAVVEPVSADGAKTVIGKRPPPLRASNSHFCFLNSSNFKNGT